VLLPAAPASTGSREDDQAAGPAAEPAPGAAAAADLLLPYVQGVPRALVAAVAAGELRCALVRRVLLCFTALVVGGDGCWGCCRYAAIPGCCHPPLLLPTAVPCRRQCGCCNACLTSKKSCRTVLVLKQVTTAPAAPAAAAAAAGMRPPLLLALRLPLRPPLLAA
jgi:hypothetical protein